MSDPYVTVTINAGWDQRLPEDVVEEKGLETIEGDLEEIMLEEIPDSDREWMESEPFVSVQINVQESLQESA